MWLHRRRDTELSAVAWMRIDVKAESVEDELSIELSLEDVLNAAKAIGFVELRREEVCLLATS